MSIEDFCRNIESVISLKRRCRDGHADPESIATLLNYFLRNLPAGTFWIFPTTGDSISPRQEVRTLFAKIVEDWNAIKPVTLFIIILKGEQYFVFRKLTIKQGRQKILYSRLARGLLPPRSKRKRSAGNTMFINLMPSRNLFRRAAYFQRARRSIERLKVIEDKIEDSFYMFSKLRGIVKEATEQ